MESFPSGKEKLLEEPTLMNILNAGNVVVSADLPGIGELYDPEFRGDGFVQGVPFNYIFIANLTGKSIPGVQAEAIDLMMQFVASNDNFNDATLNVVTEGSLISPSLLHAIFKNTFKKIAVLDPPPPGSYFCRNENYYDPLFRFLYCSGERLVPIEWKGLALPFLPNTSVKIFAAKNKQQPDKINQLEIVDFLRK